MKKYFFILLTVTSTLILSQALQAGDSIIHKEISPEEAKKLIEKNHSNKRFIILDVRTRAEYNRYHLKKAILIDYYSTDFISSLKKLDRNNTYLIYCRSSNRTRRVLLMMKDLGFKRVFEMKGGIIEWIKSGYRVE